MVLTSGSPRYWLRGLELMHRWVNAPVEACYEKAIITVPHDAHCVGARANLIRALRAQLNN